MLLLFLLVPEVNALTYSDYTPFSEFSENIIYKSDTVDVITEKRYKYYKTNKEMGPYLLESANSDYEYIDYDDYILSAPSQILYEKPDDTNRVVTIKKEYESVEKTILNKVYEDEGYYIKNYDGKGEYYHNELAKKFQYYGYISLDKINNLIEQLLEKYKKENEVNEDE